jgi:tRNA-dihydrouridine synthase
MSNSTYPGTVYHMCIAPPSPPHTVTVKCRIGVDDFDSYEELTRFIMAARLGGARKFIIHARKCLLDGLSPKQNRDVPPLHYDIPHRLVQEFPDLRFIINGGVTTLSQANVHLAPYTHTPCISCTPQVRKMQ